MNVNFKFNREEESFLVSDEQGIMQTREYQDNMGDILKLENVNEKQQESLDKKKEKQKSKMQDLNEIIQEMPNAKKEDIFSWIFLLFFMPGIPLIATLVYIIKVGFAYAWLIFFAATIFCGCFDIVASSGAFWPFQYRKKKREKQELEKSIQNLNLEISGLEQVLAKNKLQCQKLLEEKTKDNMQNVSTAIQTVSYKEELELQKVILNQLLQEKVIEQQEPEVSKQNGMILSRFRKLKKGN